MRKATAKEKGTTSIRSRAQYLEALAEIKSNEDSLSNLSNTIRELKRTIAEQRRNLPLAALSELLCSLETPEPENPAGPMDSPGATSESDLSRCERKDMCKWVMGSNQICGVCGLMR